MGVVCLNVTYSLFSVICQFSWGQKQRKMHLLHVLSLTVSHTVLCVCVHVCVCMNPHHLQPHYVSQIFFICYLFVLQYTSFCLCNCFELWKKGGGGGLSETDVCSRSCQVPWHHPIDNELTKHGIFFFIYCQFTYFLYKLQIISIKIFYVKK